MNPHRDRCCGPDRREFLRSAASGFALLPFAELWLRAHAPAGSGIRGSDVRGSGIRGSGALVRHHAPRARSVIFLYMDGGPSQVDTFDHKPRLLRENGRPFAQKIEPTQFDNVGATLASPFAFHQYGESGQWVSDLFPYLARSADRLCVVRSLVSDFSEHTSANYFLHTGNGQQGRPSTGAWAAYGLGCDSDELPAFVVLNGGLIPPGGVDCFHSGFLPAATQGSMFRMRGEPLSNVTPRDTASAQRAELDLLAALDRTTLDRSGGADAIAAAIHNQELAFRMQAAVPGLFDLDGESAATRRRYGVDADYKHTATFARQCLVARRLVERGVRFVELLCPDTGHDRWDQHSNLQRGLLDNCRTVDQPIAALLEDLALRGLLDETLVVWTGEFGRTPFAQGKNGRDHNPFGFTGWLAGGGARPGTSYGQTDEHGYKVVQDPVTIHDLHATMLHLLGIDHEKLTYRFQGRDFRLTDVSGKVVRGLLA